MFRRFVCHIGRQFGEEIIYLCARLEIEPIQIRQMKMKRLVALMGLILIMTLGVSAQQAKRIVGTYLTEKENAKVRITQQGDRFTGTIIWSITPGATDKNNPDEAERSKPIVGKVILRDFVYDGDDVWDSGKIYDPESGKTYSCKITRLADGRLKVRGFIGVSLIGRTSYWKPVKQ